MSISSLILQLGYWLGLQRKNEQTNEPFIYLCMSSSVKPFIVSFTRACMCEYTMCLCFGMCRKVKLVNFNSLFLLFYGFHHCTFRTQAPFASFHCCCYYYWLIFNVCSFFILLLHCCRFCWAANACMRVYIRSTYTI